MVAPGLRQRKKDLMRRELTRAALDLFESKGWDNTTVDDIAERCEVSPRTFFRYFATKEAVLFHDGSELLEHMLGVLRDLPIADSPYAAIKAAAMNLGVRYQADSEGILRRNRILAQNPWLRQRALERQVDWEEAVAKTITESIGERISAVDLGLLVSCTSAAFRVAISVWSDSEGKLKLPALISYAFDHVQVDLTSLRSKPSKQISSTNTRARRRVQ
jgi:AcrR family transcriptional regulator